MNLEYKSSICIDVPDEIVVAGETYLPYEYCEYGEGDYIEYSGEAEDGKSYHSWFVYIDIDSSDGVYIRTETEDNGVLDERTVSPDKVCDTVLEMVNDLNKELIKIMEESE